MQTQTQKQTYKLSPSSINLMLECKRCFWLQLVKKIKRPETPFPSLPSGMDKILKQHFDNFMEKGQLPPELCNSKECKGLRLFSDKRLLSVWRNNKKGLQWLDAKSNVLLRGAVDNILVKGEGKGQKFIVLDYKTRGFPLKKDTHEHYQAQMNLYNFLLQKNGYKTEDYAFLLFYYPKEVLPTGEVIFDTRLIKLRVNVKNAEGLFEDAVRILRGRCPAKGCEWCEWVMSKYAKSLNKYSLIT